MSHSFNYNASLEKKIAKPKKKKTVKHIHSKNSVYQQRLLMYQIEKKETISRNCYSGSDLQLILIYARLSIKISLKYN